MRARPPKTPLRASRISRLGSCSDGRARTARVARRRSRRGRGGDATWPRPLRRGARGRASRRRGRAGGLPRAVELPRICPRKIRNHRQRRPLLLVSSQTSQRALRGSGEPAMSEADGALISHLDDLQARLSRVAALSAPVDVAVGSARSSPARALKKRAAHSPRPTSLVSPLASPALEGRAAYYQTRDVVPGRAKRRYEIPPRHEPGGSDTTRTPPSLHATHHHETRVETILNRRQSTIDRDRHRTTALRR